MGFKCGIVGLPNVGKSTLFNALTATINAQMANYPFCTIEPNVGLVAVPDDRLNKLAELDKSAKIIPTQLEFVDIAGLVKGASRGEGLGNQFLGNIREVDAIIHVLRCFDDDDITHVSGIVNPKEDADVVETELMLADLENVEKRLVGVRKKAQSGDKESKTILPILEKALTLLQEGKPAALAEPDDPEEKKLFKNLALLSSKPVLYVCNVAESDVVTGNAYTQSVQKMAVEKGAGCVLISAKIEAEISQLPPDEQKEFLADLGLKETGLTQIIKEGYRILNLKTYFTSGPKEAHAWTFTGGMLAPQCAGIIHTDFEKGFIRAEVVSYDDYVSCGGLTGARENGKVRGEGKTYAFQDGDVVHFLFNV